MKNYCDQAIEILRATCDGEDLSPEHLKLLETAVNGWLSEASEVAFAELYANVQRGYVRPWYHGIEHLTKDHEGYVYWKGIQVEHYDFRDYDEAGKAAQELASRCRQLETAGVPVNCTNAIWRWPESLTKTEAA